MLNAISAQARKQVTVQDLERLCAELLAVIRGAEEYDDLARRKQLIRDAESAIVASRLNRDS